VKQIYDDTKRFQFDISYLDEPKVYDEITLFQIGDINCNRNYAIESHIQDYYEIIYVVSGKGCFFSDDKKYSVKRGDIYINFPQQKHKGEADKNDPFRYLYMGFMFNRHLYEEDAYSHIKKMLHKVEFPVIQDQLELQNSFMQALNEIYEASEYSEIMIKSYIQQILVKTYRNFCPNWECKYAPTQKLDGNQKIIHDIITYIDSNIMKISELTQISKSIGYSYSYLSHVFSEETGLTLQAYYVKKRIEKATELLNNSEFNITNISDILQYKSIHSFSKAFKKIMGVSPIQYQQLQKQK
jgi:AraC-like DNA-binding protein/mannose-6-phosphate isomerase-like protein (cupin superfamily)